MHINLEIFILLIYEAFKNNNEMDYSKVCKENNLDYYSYFIILNRNLLNNESELIRFKFFKFEFHYNIDKDLENDLENNLTDEQKIIATNYRKSRINNSNNNII